MLTEANGIPIAVAVDAANASEVVMGLAVLTMVLLTLPTKPGKPIPILGDRGYDCDDLRLRLERRWKLERNNAWLHSYRRAVTRHEKSVNRFEGFVS